MDIRTQIWCFFNFTDAQYNAVVDEYGEGYLFDLYVHNVKKLKKIFGTFGICATFTRM